MLCIFTHIHSGFLSDSNKYIDLHYFLVLHRVHFYAENHNFVSLHPVWRHKYSITYLCYTVCVCVIEGETLQLQTSLNRSITFVSHRPRSLWHARAHTHTSQYCVYITNYMIQNDFLSVVEGSNINTVPLHMKPHVNPTRSESITWKEGERVLREKKEFL